MPTIACPNCHKNLNVPEKYAGRSAKCPACQKPFLVEFQEPVAIDLEAIVRDDPTPDFSPPPLPQPPVSSPAAENPAGSQINKKLLVVGGLIMAVLLLAVAGKWIFSASTGSADQEAVRSYLREHRDAGKWEEVRWWPAHRVDKIKAEYVDSLRDAAKVWREATMEERARIKDRTPWDAMFPDPKDRAKALAGAEDQQTEHERDADKRVKGVEDFANEPTPRIIRLKYRTLGALDVLHDEYFELKDGKAKPALPEWCNPKEFPE
ncbi:MAG: hypothetical protein ABSG53_10325 [Thermoguttaceae bacterium]|jgi:hypothetical protein